MLTLPHNCEWKVSAPLLVSTSYILRWSDEHVSRVPKLKARPNILIKKIHDFFMRDLPVNKILTKEPSGTVISQTHCV